MARRILVVEHDRDIAGLIDMHLPDLQCEVTLAHDGVTAPAATRIDFGELVIDTEKRTVTLRGKVIELTAKEFDLFLQFARYPGRVYTRAQLLDVVWGYGHDGYEHTVNSHINRLRSKIEGDHANPEWILTVWGVGYKFREAGESG